IESNKKNAKRIVEVEEILKKADLEVKLIHRDKEANEAAMVKVRDISVTNLLHPVMGLNYRLPASIVLARIEEKCGLDFGTPLASSGGIIPGPSLPAKSDLKTFNMSIGIACTYSQFITLLQAIREENSYIAISRVSISGQSKTPEEHRVGCLISWPIWADPKMENTVKGEKAGTEDEKPEAAGAAPAEAKTEGGKTR
ncbi:hypothetical protein ACFLQU_04885, partial [Verrucomicrobiota bacterium]